MTQIISVITPEYALLVSDRLLTYADGPHIGKPFFDDECKLVSLCFMNGIGYSGFARLGGMRTHEWIAKNLAQAGCREASHASEILLAEAESALPNVTPRLRRQTFVICGWAKFEGLDSLQPHICVVSNCLGHELEQLAMPEPSFRRRIRVLQKDEHIFSFAIGAPIRADRAVRFARNLRRMGENRVGPRDTLRILVAEVFATHQYNTSVGDTVLALCIPRTHAESIAKTGQAGLVGAQPNSVSATYSYFDREYNEFRQPGPTTVCGEFAATDLLYTNEPSKPLQSISWRLLNAPTKKP